MYLVQLGKKIRLIDAGLGTDATIGTKVSMYRDGSMTETEDWTVIKLFDREELHQMRALRTVMGYEAFNKFFEAFLAFEVL